METEIEESKKWIKLLLWLDKLKARIEPFAKKALPLILHRSPWSRFNTVGEFGQRSVWFSQECQDCMDMALTSPAAKDAMIQRNLGLTILASFQHMRKSRVQGYLSGIFKCYRSSDCSA